jgi:hypothetical protein
MRKLRIILALACSFAAFTHAAAQVKAPGRASAQSSRFAATLDVMNTLLLRLPTVRGRKKP